MNRNLLNIVNKWQNHICYPSVQEVMIAPFHINLTWYRHLQQPQNYQEREILRIIKRKLLI